MPYSLVKDILARRERVSTDEAPSGCHSKLDRHHIRVCADLSVLLVRCGVVGDLEEVQVDHFFHLIVVSSPLAYNHRRIEQEDVPAVQRASCH